MTMHRLLQRQLKKLDLSPDRPPSGKESWRAFLDRISNTYADADQYRYLQERSLAISSVEMQELYDNLRHSSEDRIRAERNRLRAVISSLGAGLCILDQDGLIVSINPEAERLLGWLERELKQQPVLTIMAEPKSSGAADDHRQRLSEALSSGRQYHNEGEFFLNKQQQEFPVFYTLNPIFEESGLTGAVLVFLDLTDRKRAEEELRKTHQKLKSHVENSPLAVVEWDKFFRVQYWSPQAEKIFGWKVGDIVGKKLNESKWVYCEDVAAVKRTMARLVSGEEVKSVSRNRNYRKDGSVIHCEWYNSALFDDSGSLMSILSLVQDITDRQRAEEDQLKSQKLESLGVLAGGIAHDFNNLLTTILANVSLTKESTDGDLTNSDRLTKAERACMQATALTKQLLTFSRGGAPIRRAVSIWEVLRQTASFTLSGSNIKCEFNIPGDIWTVNVDEGQISQVFQNLILNGDQAMKNGGILRISAENVKIRDRNELPLKVGKYVKIAVEDQGEGIPQKYLSKIFDPYFTTKSDGNGLGLATTYSIVRRHDGCITVDSVVNVGTKFQIYLPVAESHAAAVGESEGGVRNNSGKILLMDDDDAIRDVAADILNSLGFRVELAADGVSALDIYVQAKQCGEPFDGVILDLTVPGGMGGCETFEKLIKIDPSVKGIVSSGYSNDPALANWKTYGFSGMITKPFKVSDLAKIAVIFSKDHNKPRERRETGDKRLQSE